MATGKKGVRSRLADGIYTYCAFWIALSALPALTLSYIVVRISKHLWLKLLASKYPELQFIRTDTVRSLLDTHRNQGIINVLLSVKGIPNPEEIKEQLIQHVIDRRDKNGDLMFPRLRHMLVSCWGKYAWDPTVPFRPENHFIVTTSVYRGRPVGDNNIQEYVSEIISKYFPNDLPPWQYIIIPCASTEPKYYILVRVHHLFLTGEKSINIGDLLLLEQLSRTDNLSLHPGGTQQSPLVALFPSPSAIPELWGKLNENLSNAWNEFVSEYDPVESPRALKTLPGVFHVAGLVMISAMSVLRELTKKRSSESSVTATTLILALQRECKRRNLTITKIFFSPLITVDPRKWPGRMFGATVTTTLTIMKLPLRLRDELIALNQLRTTGHVKEMHTMTWKYAELAQLCVRACHEAWRGLIEMYRAPAKLWNDTVKSEEGQKHLLQTVSLCGRKVTAWSRPVTRAGIERAAHALGVSSTDIALYAATEGLRAYFEQVQANTPEVVLTSARAATEDFLFTFAEGDGKRYKKYNTAGMVCLSLPIGASPRRIASVVEQACSRQTALAGAWAAQARCGALTRSVPSPLAKLALNILSRRYAVSYAEINASLGAVQRNTLWGQTVDNVIYWRPPQANISMSLTVIQYADTVRLAVMTDARLSPSHAVPATRWPTAIDQLVSKIDQELARISTKAHALNIPLIITPQETEELTNYGTEQIPESSGLKPPTAEVVSPPPIRRRISQRQ